MISYKQPGQYSAQSGKLSNLCLLTEYLIFIDQRTFLALVHLWKFPQGHVTAYVIVYGQLAVHSIVIIFYKKPYPNYLTRSQDNMLNNFFNIQG